ncbi:thioredoxin reductase (NADPH) [Polynucleobacter sphagniphilus]|uniref:Ferredoxin--NADP reductase n=1 Tax=Polynucleobacter sphagniphilus TaxID=1743169 RepID=A0AA43M742_9BURK|nr:NAD(P)/FAD-dependent oxidoreductase [Polynucleobacter sphagniphilus]MDF9787483.1 thioredoxin reductase (NADPH) [Polynucleobacter sphagniphilus]MDH6154142.1 thioredoxin reductase (NADPH) [Polynucleobacter sphagniphilus]MDH6240415.1 thioredoxin reductase (NADPH) [Polynucleobacter sphagniphilus]MDH6248284.1 thioredoxin reductase (NADPH) [Polynucleobacter sphagniphilus]MDH6299794.1 thioredoxin reductase (NADPH) [Polynucleobacter sphagniphilus]
MNQPTLTDALIIGAGPVGLFQVFELGLLEIKSHVIDSLPAVGGQCIELYPDKPIYDIPAIPVCTGRELTNNLLKQIEPFAPQFHLGQEVASLERQGDGRFLVSTSQGNQFLSKTVFVAAGVGAFQPRTLKLEGIEAFEGKQLFYHVNDPERFTDKQIVICGGGDSALDWALHLVGKAKSVTLLHRRDDFKATPKAIGEMRRLCAKQKMALLIGQISSFETMHGRLCALQVTDIDGLSQTIPVDDLLVFFGLSPKLGPIADWGLTIDRKQITVDTEKFQTNIPGIYAVGDINIYPGKKKLILSGFHEAALAAFAAAAYLQPEKQIPLQYTTTSPKLHKALGVSSPNIE